VRRRSFLVSLIANAIADPRSRIGTAELYDKRGEWQVTGSRRRVPGALGAGKPENGSGVDYFRQCKKLRHPAATW